MLPVVGIAAGASAIAKPKGVIFTGTLIFGPEATLAIAGMRAWV